MTEKVAWQHFSYQIQTFIKIFIFSAQSQSESVRIQSDYQGSHEYDEKQVTHSEHQIG